MLPVFTFQLTKVVTIDVRRKCLVRSFYRAVNIHGPALVIDGNNWISDCQVLRIFHLLPTRSVICQPECHACSTNRCKPSHDDTFLCIGKPLYLEYDGSSFGQLSGMGICVGGGLTSLKLILYPLKGLLLYFPTSIVDRRVPGENFRTLSGEDYGWRH